MQEIPDSAIVFNKMNQYGRCQIGAEIFGLTTSARHIKVHSYWPNLLIVME